MMTSKLKGNSFSNFRGNFWWLIIN
jgi:hypothetical protein